MMDRFFVRTGFIGLLYVAGYCAAAASMTTDAPASGGVCLKPCVCKWKGGKESVTCHQAGWTEIPTNGFDTTVQVLDLSGNPLTTLGANQFRRLGLTHLQRVILQRCSLRHVDSTAFAGLTNLVELDLSHNALSTVPAPAFVYVPELRELKLNGNPLARINASPFSAAVKLVRLEMANCQIIQLNDKAFSNLESLEWLRLDGNLIESLPTGALAPLRSLRGIDLHHNPWNCTCSLRPLRSWLAARNMPFSVPPLCLTPARLRGQSWNRMPLDELACPPRIHAVDALVQSATGQPATLSCSVKSNPEASVSWFFADRLIVNISDEVDSSHQVYLLRETGDKTDKTVQLTLNSAREQDSGFYVCQAVNRADKVTANVTLLVKGGVTELSSGRGFTAGLILAVFAVLIVVLLICCVCSLKRARSHASLRRRSVTGAQSNGHSEKALDVQAVDGRMPKKLNGSLKRPMSIDGRDVEAESVRTPIETTNETTHFPDKQWLVSRDVPKLSRQTSSDADQSHHREIAMYQNQKVLYNASSSPPDSQAAKSLSPTRSILSSSPKVRNYPDLVDVIPVDYEPSETLSIDEEFQRKPTVDLRQLQLQQQRRPLQRRLSVAESTGSASGSLSQQQQQRHRWSDWELNELDANPEWVTHSYNPHEWAYDPEPMMRYPDEFEDDFQRRYAYHTGQLNRFLCEYRALQKKLARMQDTWGRCLDAPELVVARPPTMVQYRAQRPLRPILKNRLPAPVRPPPPPPPWTMDEIVDSDSPPTPVNESPSDEIFYR